jgi:hypothetical protein
MARGKTARIAVHFFAEDGFMVRGVSDPCEAYRLALEEAIDSDWNGQRIGGWAYDAGQPEVEGETAWPNTEKDITALADEVWEKIKSARVRRCRIVPTGPDHPEGYTWMVWEQSDDAKGPGIFTAVMFF